MSPRNVICSAAIPAALLAVAGCASNPRPVADLAGAQTLVTQAEQSDAQQFDSADVASARSKLNQANAIADSKPVMAANLAQESSVDSEVALARTRAAKAAQAAAEADSGNRTLRNEADRSADPPNSPPPPAPSFALPPPPAPPQ